MLADINTHTLLPPIQFGSWDYHSAPDVALALVYNIQACRKSGYVSALLLFDVQGFFDNINIPQLLHIFSKLGFPRPLCTWLASFLHNRHIHLMVNGIKGDPFVWDAGTPQGLPLSPILSAIYTSPLLKLVNRTWQHRSLQMYVDDRSIFACSSTYHAAARKAEEGFKAIMEWLYHNGLGAEPDKTEFMIFAPR